MENGSGKIDLLDIFNERLMEADLSVELTLVYPVCRTVRLQSIIIRPVTNDSIYIKGIVTS